jgi:hypothetical protein
MFNQRAFLGQVPIAGLGSQPFRAMGYAPPSGSFAPETEKEARQKADLNNICDLRNEHGKAKGEGEKSNWKKSFQAAVKAYANRYNNGDLRSTLTEVTIKCPQAPGVVPVEDLVPRNWWDRPKIQPSTTTPRANQPTGQLRPMQPQGWQDVATPTVPSSYQPVTSAALPPVGPRGSQIREGYPDYPVTYPPLTPTPPQAASLPPVGPRGSQIREGYPDYPVTYPPPPTPTPTSQADPYNLTPRFQPQSNQYNLTPPDMRPDVATGQCPPDSQGNPQFYDGRQCRGSVAPGAAGLVNQAMNLGPSGATMTPSGGMMPGGYSSGGAPAYTMGVRYPVANL